MLDQIFLQDLSDYDLAELWWQYQDAPGTSYLHDIFWEANRRGYSPQSLIDIINETDDEAHLHCNITCTQRTDLCTTTC